MLQKIVCVAESSYASGAHGGPSLRGVPQAERRRPGGRRVPGPLGHRHTQ